MTVQSISVPAAGLIRRYTEGYRVAGVIILFAKLVQIFGILATVGGAVFAILLLDSNGSLAGGADIMVVKIVIGVAALFAAFVFWVIGIIVAAQGQHLRASLDCAVHGSPFLSNEQKRQAQGVL